MRPLSGFCKLSFFLRLAVSALLLSGCAMRNHPGRREPVYTVLQERPDRVVAKLDNRLIVVAQRMPAAPVVSAQVWVKTGSIYEQEYSGAGISHFLEHLLSGGSTSTRSESETNEILGRMGAQKNAATGLDGVYYYLNTSSRHAFKAVDLLSDWMINATIPEEEFQREREVIQQEFSMGEGEPQRIFWRLTQQARYASHPARHPTIGYIDEFLEITRDQVIDFYNRMYAPNNIVFTVAGDIDPHSVVQRVAGNWDGVPPRDLPEVRFPVEEEPSSPGSLSGRADLRRPRIRLAWPASRQGEEHDYALDLLAAILGQGETSRLNRVVRDRLGYVTSVSAYNLSFDWGEGFFGIDAETSAGGAGFYREVKRAVDSVLEQVRLLRDEKVSLEELDRAKRNVLSSVMNANQSVQEVASRQASDIISSGDPDYIYRYAREMQGLTADDLLEAARRYLLPERLITVKLLPETDEERARPLSRVPGSGDAKFDTELVELDNELIIEKLKDRAGASEGTAVESGPYSVFRLDNGLRVMVQRSTVVPAVSMQIYLKGGLLGEKEGREGTAAAAAVMMTRGTPDYSSDEFAEEVENLGARISASSGYNTDFIQAYALSDDWPRVMELMAETLLKPVFPDDQWSITRPRILAAIDRQADSWYGELTQRFRKTYFRGHPWSYTSLGRRETVENLTSDDLRDFHYSRLGASDMVIAVAGDADPEEVLSKAEELFGGIPEKAPVAPGRPVPLPQEEGEHRFRTAKPVTAVTIGFGPVVDRAHEDYAALTVLGAVISDFPGGWLQQALRGGGPGLVYAAWARLVTGLVPGYFEVTFNTSFEHSEEAVRRAMEVIRRAKEETVSAEDMERAVAKVISGEFLARQSNADRAQNAALDELYGIGDPEGELFLDRLSRLTPEDLQEAAVRYLRDPVTVIISND